LFESDWAASVVYGHDDDDGDHAKSRRQEAKFASLEDGILRSTALPAGTLLGALFDAFESLVDFVDAAHQATELLVVRLHQLEKIVHGVILPGREIIISTLLHWTTFGYGVEWLLTYLEGGISRYLQGTLASWQPWQGCPPSHFDFLLRQFSQA
jgi:hypothetical protein